MKRSVNEIWNQQNKEGWSSERFEQELRNEGHIISKSEMEEKAKTDKLIAEANDEMAKRLPKTDGIRKPFNH